MNVHDGFPPTWGGFAIGILYPLWRKHTTRSLINICRLLALLNLYGDGDVLEEGVVGLGRKEEAEGDCGV